MSQRRTASSPPACAAAADAPDTRENQLLAIAALFARDGYERTSMRDIAEVADITKAALYYYFPTRQRCTSGWCWSRCSLLVDDVSAAEAAAGLSDGAHPRHRAVLGGLTDLARDRDGRFLAFREGGRERSTWPRSALRDRYENPLRQCISEGIASERARHRSRHRGPLSSVRPRNADDQLAPARIRPAVTEVMRCVPVDMALHGWSRRSASGGHEAAGPRAARSAKAWNYENCALPPFSLFVA